MLAASVLVLSSCIPFRPPGRKLPPPPMSLDSSVLDIFFVRFPCGDPDANGSLWDEIDEQHFPTDLRRRLAENGFRAGLVGGQMPVKLAQMLQLQDKPPATGQWQQVTLEDLESPPTVVQRHLQLRANRRSEIFASGVYDEMPVLRRRPGGICGDSYANAQGIFALKAFLDPDGRVRLDLVPEVHYGENVQRFVPAGRTFRLETGQPRCVFDDLTVSAALGPGDMLVLTSLPNRLGTLGHRFFTHQCEGRQEQKLLVIRLSQTQHDGLFSPDTTLALED